MTTARPIDRAARVRRALVELVADRGFRGTSMAAVAAQAGVATGTAYVHYASKDELVLAAYREVKRELGLAAAAALDPAAPPEDRFRAMWYAIHEHLSADPQRARFLEQVDASPYRNLAHDATMQSGENTLLDAIATDLSDRFVALPLDILYSLAIGPIVRLAAAGIALGERELALLAQACWRAVTR